jgi:hypothetical protein
MKPNSKPQVTARKTENNFKIFKDVKIVNY